MLLQQAADLSYKELLLGFNTASGRCCCNRAKFNANVEMIIFVSIPQAVGVVATKNTSGDLMKK